MFNNVIIYSLILSLHSYSLNREARAIFYEYIMFVFVYHIHISYVYKYLEVSV